MALRADVSRRDNWFLGENKTLAFTIWQDAAKTTPQDISGWVLAYDFYADGEVEFTLDMNDITITDGPAGEGEVAVESALTTALTDRRDLHHVLRRDEGGAEYVLFIGDVILNDPAGG